MSGTLSTMADCNAARTALLEAYRAIPYGDYLRTDHWRAIRMGAIDRSRGHCQLCGKTEQLHVHHNSYKNLGEERPEDLIVLCQGCHKKFHDNVTPAENAEKISGGELRRREANPREVAAVEVEPGFVLNLGFMDGTMRKIEFKPLLGLKELNGLEDESLFKQIDIDGDGNLRWPNQSGISRDVLYEWPKDREDLTCRASGDIIARATLDSKLKIRSVEILGRFILRLHYENGSSEVLNFSWILRHKLFQPLKDLSIFNQALIDDSGTLCWPNGIYVDMAFLARFPVLDGYSAENLALALKQKEVKP